MLSILIPTYNRSNFLNKNLEQLYEVIKRGNWEESIQLVISNNFSTDNTFEIIDKFKRQDSSISILSFNQERNIGLENNSLFVLQNASMPFVMFLGDDDYLSYSYLENVLDVIKNEDVNCIIPSYVPVFPNGEKIPNSKGRDVDAINKRFNKGFLNCLENSWRGHQLSGLVFKRKGLYESYKNQNVSNIYPFIYFTALSCLNGMTFLLVDYPILVTQPGQQNKDWGYGNIGLLDEIFDNYKKLDLDSLKKTRLQFKILDEQIWRIKNSLRNGKISFITTLFNAWFCRNSTLLFRVCFPFYIFFRFVRSFF